jgi:hypothetical protein
MWNLERHCKEIASSKIKLSKFIPYSKSFPIIFCSKDYFCVSFQNKSDIIILLLGRNLLSCLFCGNLGKCLHHHLVNQKLKITLGTLLNVSEGDNGGDEFRIAVGIEFGNIVTW